MSRALSPRIAVACVLAVAACPRICDAGPVNPDISVIARPAIRWTGDPDDPDRKRVTMDVGETEIVFDAALNPYARGFLALSLGEEGLELEEGYFTLVRGLPLELALRGGKYRAGFGRLNAAHPHTDPFPERFGVLKAYLPGEESLNETGLSVARRIAVAGEFSVNLAADWLQGDSFRISREPGPEGDPLRAGGDDDAALSRPAFLGRLSGFTMIGDRSALEIGVSGTAGTNNVAAETRTAVFGLDAKARVATSPRAHLVLQGELLHLSREDAAWSTTSGYESSTESRTGGYAFADYTFADRYNLGASFERFAPPGAADIASAAGLFAGLSLLEETTAFRAGWVRTDPGAGRAFHAFSLRVVYSMGPHKAHWF